MPWPSTEYEPRSAAQGALYQIVHDHFETFRAQAASLRDGEGLPRFVEHAFRTFLQCGWLAGGFARLRCGDCGLDRLIPFSCKGRALCPSCGGRRMAERAAHLVDHVFPDVPVRQWVLSLPYRLRYQLAWDHDLCRAVVGMLLGAVGRVLRARAQDEGVEAGRGGGVAVIQRFGGALNLNVHIHALVLDGVFARDDRGALRFHVASGLTTLDVAEVLATVEPLIARQLQRRGCGEGEAERPTCGKTRRRSWRDWRPRPFTGRSPLAPVGAPTFVVQATRPSRSRRSLRGRVTPGRTGLISTRACSCRPGSENGSSGSSAMRCGRPWHLRLHLTKDGQVRLALRHPWRDGTTDLVFDPVEFLGRLAVLVPRPRINLLLYYGVLGPRAAWRAEVVPRQATRRGDAAMTEPASEPAREPAAAETAQRCARGQCWASLMARTFGCDVLACPRCGGRLRLVAVIEDSAVIGRILQHLGLPTEVPAPRPARAPPLQLDTPDPDGWDDDRSVFDSGS